MSTIYEKENACKTRGPRRKARKPASTAHARDHGHRQQQHARWLRAWRARHIGCMSWPGPRVTVQCTDGSQLYQQTTPRQGTPEATARRHGYTRVARGTLAPCMRHVRCCAPSYTRAHRSRSSSSYMHGGMPHKSRRCRAGGLNQRTPMPGVDAARVHAVPCTQAANRDAVLVHAACSTACSETREMRVK